MNLNEWRKLVEMFGFMPVITRSLIPVGEYFKSLNMPLLVERVSSLGKQMSGQAKSMNDTLQFFSLGDDAE
ncbi:hypothetical protein L4C34_00135 [Vibrio profundum]